MHPDLAALLMAQRQQDIRRASAEHHTAPRAHPRVGQQDKARRIRWQWHIQSPIVRRPTGTRQAVAP